MGGSHDEAGGHPAPEAASPMRFRAMAMRDLLIEKGLLSAEDVERELADQDARSPTAGARLVARAWVDDEFRSRLLSDAKRAAAELGIDVSDMNEFVVLENTQDRQHLVVCTLCSCYPRPVLGRPPDWYKSDAYRSRAVREPRALMSEFGYTPAAEAEIVVVDSTADRRFMVLPTRPRGTESLSEDQLVGLVTRDSMIGIRPPADEGIAGTAP
jgi:hypothetical protein